MKVNIAIATLLEKTAKLTTDMPIPTSASLGPRHAICEFSKPFRFRHQGQPTVINIENTKYTVWL